MKTKFVIAIVLIGTFIFCLPSAWKFNQGSYPASPEVIKSLETGQCHHEDYLLVCDLTDPATAKKWTNALEQQVEQLKIEAGKPAAILSKVCRDKGFTDSDCPKILTAMAKVESGMGKWMVGDNGQSHGFFHIMFYHNVPKSCSEDLKCSATWTLNRMVAKGFATNRANAIRLHNGGLSNPKTLAYLKAVKSRM